MRRGRRREGEGERGERRGGGRERRKESEVKVNEG